MKPRTIKYYFREALRSVFRNRFMSIASIFAVASSIFIVAVFYIIAANMEYFMNQLEAQMGISVRIEDHRTDSEILTLRERLRVIPNVAEITFVSREEHLEGMGERIGHDLIAGFWLNNPLRNSFTVELTDLVFHDEVERAILNLTHYGVAEVHSAAEFARSLSTLSSIVQLVSLALVLILAAISVIIITNTIRITVNTRKTEINIMKYVGATDWFIRWPFVLEGMIIGLLGGIVPALLCWFGYSRIVNAVGGIPQLAFIEFLSEDHIMTYVIPISVILGVFIGLFGSITSVKKHLKV